MEKGASVIRQNCQEITEEDGKRTGRFKRIYGHLLLNNITAMLI